MMIDNIIDLFKNEEEKPKRPNINEFVSTDKMKPIILKSSVRTTTDDTEKIRNHYIIPISTPIGMPEQMLEVVDLLRNCTSDDFIEMVISTPGGYVHTMLDLLEAMSECQAPIKTVANGVVASCGFVIWSHGDIIEHRSLSCVMAHATSHMSWGKSLDIIDEAEGIVDCIKNLLGVAIEKGLLTKPEYNQLIDERKDIYLFKEDLDDRLKKYNSRNIELIDDVTNIDKVLKEKAKEKEGENKNV